MVAVASEPGRRTRDASLDGIRGIAALAVLVEHAILFTGVLPYAPLGNMGVLIFFALSGYLIAGICWRAAPTWAAYRVFLTRRVVRLGPVMLALVLAGGAALVFSAGFAAGDVATDGVIVLSQGTAFAMASGVDIVQPFQPTWSLTVEWAFYLTFPLTVMALRRLTFTAQQVARLLAGTSVAFYLLGLALPPAKFYWLPVANLGVLFAGAALAVWHQAAPLETRVSRPDPARTVMAMAMLAILFLLPGQVVHSLGWKAAVFPAVVACALTVIHGCWAGDGASRLLARGPLHHVGVRAYSLYLWHLPVMWIVWVNMPESVPIVRFAAVVAMIVVVVVASFEILERPVMRTRPTSARRRT